MNDHGLSIRTMLDDLGISERMAVVAIGLMLATLVFMSCNGRAALRQTGQAITGFSKSSLPSADPRRSPCR